jgi:hypothetical protein
MRINNKDENKKGAQKIERGEETKNMVSKKRKKIRI